MPSSIRRPGRLCVSSRGGRRECAASTYGIPVRASRESWSLISSRNFSARESTDRRGAEQRSRAFYRGAPGEAAEWKRSPVSRIPAGVPSFGWNCTLRTIWSRRFPSRADDGTRYSLSRGVFMLLSGNEELPPSVGGMPGLCRPSVSGRCLYACGAQTRRWHGAHGRSMDWLEDIQNNLWVFPRG